MNFLNTHTKSLTRTAEGSGEANPHRRRQPRSESANLQSSIRNLQSSICNLQFAIFNPKSAICNLQSAIRNLQFSILNFSFFILFFTNISFSQTNAVSFTQEDRDRIIRTETRLDEGLKQIDKRFELVDQRFEQSNTFMGWMIALFGGMFATTIIFALWDRRTMIRPFESKVKEIDAQIDILKADSANKSVISALRELAKSDSKLAEILKMHNLL
jgi:hypothetical protein